MTFCQCPVNVCTIQVLYFWCPNAVCSEFIFILIYFYLFKSFYSNSTRFTFIVKIIRKKKSTIEISNAIKYYMLRTSAEDQNLLTKYKVLECFLIFFHFKVLHKV